MKLLVISDSHGAESSMLTAVYDNMNSDYIIFLGDGERDTECISNIAAKAGIIRIRGNCDWSSDLPAKVICEIAGHRLYITHGYAEGVKNGYYDLCACAAAEKCDIALFGHTHHFTYEKEDGIYILNPGSLMNGSYAVLTLDENRVTARQIMI